MKDRPKKHIRVVEIEPVDLDRITGGKLPVQRITVNVGGDRKGVVFTISKTTREGYTPENYKLLVQTLGDLSNPHPVTLVVLPDGETIRAYEIEAI